MGLYQSSLRTALTTATLQTSRQHAAYPLLVKQPQPQQHFPSYSRGYHYETSNHSVYVQMPDGRPGHVALPLTPSPFANPKDGNSPLTFDDMVMEKLGEAFDARLAGLCVDVMKDPDVVESLLKNPAFQELSDELALEVTSKSDLHLPALPSIGPPALDSVVKSADKAPPLPPLIDMQKEEEEEEENPPLPLLPPLQTTEDESRGENEGGKEADKIAEDVVSVVCGNCHQPLPRLDVSEESLFTEASEDCVGDVVAAPPPSQSMERLWKSIQTQADLLTLILPIVTVTLMVGIMCIRPDVRRRAGAILKSSFSKLRSALFAFGPWKRSVLRR